MDVFSNDGYCCESALNLDRCDDFGFQFFCEFMIECCECCGTVAIVDADGDVIG